MNKTEALSFYKEQNEKIRAYKMMGSICYYDRLTIAPIKANDIRNNYLSLMAVEAFKLQTDPKYIEAINQLSKCKLNKNLSRIIGLEKKEIDIRSKFTQEDERKYNLICLEAEQAWEIAKNKNDYKIFEPHLLKIISIMKERAGKINKEEKPYNVLLDIYQPSMNIEKYDEFFNLIKLEILPLIRKVNQSNIKIDESFLYKKYSKEKQIRFTNKCLLPFIKYTKEWGYLTETEHPFTIGILSNDSRITTNYDENFVISNIFSVIHEAGHAYYEHNVDKKYSETIIRDSITSGMHESQSRFLENYIAKRESFWLKLYPKLQKQFKKNLINVSLSDFMKGINISKCSLIRTDADELTYPIHILIRYEIEKGIFDNSIDINNLVNIWKEKYKEYLGIDVPNDSLGILQDIHWSDGSFGYFPTYALGSAIGAQIMNKMETDLSVDELLSNGKFSEIMKYLKNNIQKYGNLYDLDELLKLSTGENFNPKYYINYLKNKYSLIYDLH